MATHIITISQHVPHLSWRTRRHSLCIEFLLICWDDYYCGKQLSCSFQWHLILYVVISEGTWFCIVFISLPLSLPPSLTCLSLALWLYFPLSFSVLLSLTLCLPPSHYLSLFLLLSLSLFRALSLHSPSSSLIISYHNASIARFGHVCHNSLDMPSNKIKTMHNQTTTIQLSSTLSALCCVALFVLISYATALHSVHNIFVHPFDKHKKLTKKTNFDYTCYVDKKRNSQNKYMQINVTGSCIPNFSKNPLAFCSGF